MKDRRDPKQGTISEWQPGRRRVAQALLLLLLELSISILDHLTPPAVPVSYLYHVPIVLGANWFGYAGAVVVSLGSALLFHLTTTLESSRYGEADVVRILTFLLVGTLVAELTRRRRKTEALNRQLVALQVEKESLTRLIVHDLKTPLSNLLGGLRTFQHTSANLSDDLRQELLAIAVRGGESLLAMVEDLLSVEQIKAGRFIAHAETCSGHELVLQAVEQVKYLGDQKKIDLVVRPVKEPCRILCDRPVSLRVLVNLLGNAIRYTAQGGVVEIELVRIASEEETALFCVSDTGPGIPGDYLETVFEEFVQVEMQKEGARVGTGLGLAFCKLVIESQGGRIWVESVLGEGSRFYFTLPLAVSVNNGER